MIVELLHRQLHPRPSGRRHAGMTAQHARNGADADSGFFGDITNCGQKVILLSRRQRVPIGSNRHYPLMLIDKWDLRNGPYLRIMELEPVPRQCDAPATGVPNLAIDHRNRARILGAAGICAQSTRSYFEVNASKSKKRFRKKEPDAVTPLTDRLSPLGDFTATNRMVLLSGAALAVGIFNAFVAWFLLRLIGLF